MTISLAIVYYSSTGFSARIGQEIGNAAEKAGATARVAHIPVATPDDLEWADAVIFGTPTRFGDIAAQGANPIGDQTLNAARHQAERIVRFASALKTGSTS